MRELTLVFDLDGTLVDTAPDLISATNYVLALKGLSPVADALVRPSISRGARAMIRAGLAHHGVTLEERDIADLLESFLEHYGANIAVASRPFPGAVTALDRFRAEGTRLAICTNKTEALSWRLLEALNLGSAFHALAGRDTLAVCKPHPGHLLGTIAMAGGRADRAIMVGDSNTDIDAADAAGIPVIGVTFGYCDPPMQELAPTVMIDGFDAFDAAVSQILKAGEFGAKGLKTP